VSRRLHRAVVPILVLASAAVLLTGAAGGSGASTHGHRHGYRLPCSPRGSFTRYRDTRVRLYAQYNSDDDQDIYACLLSTGKRSWIASCAGDPHDPGPCQELDKLRVEAPRIAYSLRVTGIEGFYGWVCVLNLRTGARRCSLTDYFPGGLGLSRAGSLAWLDAPHDVCCAVHKIDAGAGNPVLLDSGGDIDRTSFAVGGRYAYWTKAGAPRSATLP
jgi:hypothetical protein